MGTFCEKCSKLEEREENDEDYDCIEKINISPKNSINKGSPKKCNLKKKNSDNKSKGKSTKNIKADFNIFKFEEEEEDITPIKKKDSRQISFINPKNINFPHLNKIKTNPKYKSEITYRRRKKRSSTVKQNQFIFAKIFCEEICIPINQENLIWEKRGLPESNYMRGRLLGKGAYGQVYESKNPIFNNKVAMKIINKNRYELEVILI